MLIKWHLKMSEVKGRKCWSSQYDLLFLRRINRSAWILLHSDAISQSISWTCTCDLNFYDKAVKSFKGQQQKQNWVKHKTKYLKKICMKYWSQISSLVGQKHTVHSFWPFAVFFYIFQNAWQDLCCFIFICLVHGYFIQIDCKQK